MGSEQHAMEAPPDMARVPAGSINKQAAHWWEESAQRHAML